MKYEEMAREIVNSCYRVDPARREICYELEVKAVSERLKQVERDTIERCAKIAENESELSGEPPQEMKDKFTDDPIACLRATVKVTKNNIAYWIRTIKNEVT